MPMHRRMAILRTFAVGTLAITLALAAFSGANATVASATTVNDAAGSAEHATLHVDLSGVAAQVVSALVGGENPSTTVANRGGSEHASAMAHNDTDNDEATETEVETNHAPTGLQAGPTGTAGTKPGFGCGDTNHTHSGPPGRPGASLPPGCTKNH